ncbi:MAG: glycosyltransferase family 1 protein [Chloroflexi bacterium]|nr:MAG: glycosyltransferase family 1 protein [Chloroflexota bacterium]
MTKRIRVAHLHSYLPFGGVENHILNLCRHFDSERFELEVCLFRDGGPMLSVFEDAGVTVRVFNVVDGDGRIVNSDQARAFLAHLRSFDVAHTWYGGGPLNFGMQAAQSLRIAVQVQSIEWLVPAVDPGLDAVILESDVLKTIQEAAGVPNRLVRINAGIDLARYNPATVQPFRLFEGPVVGRVSRLVEEKDPETFVRAAALVQARHPHTNFVIAGDGPLRAQLEALAQRLGARITFLGNCTNVPAVLAAFDIFAYPTLGDSFGFVNAEAMAMGKPVISTRVGSVPELVRDGETGFLIEPQDAWGLAQCICYLLNEPEIGRRMGSQGRQLIETKFDLKQEVTAMADLYHELYHRFLGAPDRISDAPAVDTAPAAAEPQPATAPQHRNGFNLQEAQAAAEHALELAPTDINVLAAYGTVSVEAGNYEGARSALLRIQAQDPECPAALELQEAVSLLPG